MTPWRFLARSVLRLAVGTGLGAGVQLALNMDVYEQTYGLYGRLVPHGAWWGVGGVLIALVVALPYARSVRPGPNASAYWAGTGIVALCVLADGVYLSSIGMRGATDLDGLLRALSMVGTAALFTRGLSLGYRALGAVALPALAVAGLTGRYALLPVLPLPLEQGGLSPLHLLVFARDQAVVLLLAATALWWWGRRA